ncbi:MAG: carboxymuconolactone decarboxylase family protein [Dehalococcoidia bacterium]
MPAIQPLNPPYAADVEEELSRLMGRTPREPLILFRTLARHLPLTRAWGTLGAHNLTRGALTVRDRELMILRTCYLNRCEYEWGVHAKIYAGAAGFTREQFLATARPTIGDAGWSAHDLLVLRFAEALHESADADADLVAGLRRSWGDAQLLEACEITGFYHGVACIAKVAGVELEEWGERFPLD